MKNLKIISVIIVLSNLAVQSASAKDTGFSSAFPDSVAMNNQKSLDSLSPAAGNNDKNQKAQMLSHIKIEPAAPKENLTKDRYPTTSSFK